MMKVSICSSQMCVDERLSIFREMGQTEDVAHLLTAVHKAISQLLGNPVRVLSAGQCYLVLQPSVDLKEISSGSVIAEARVKRVALVAKNSQILNKLSFIGTRHV